MRGGALPNVLANCSAKARQAVGSGLGYQPPTKASSRPMEGKSQAPVPSSFTFARIETGVGDDRADLRQRLLPARQEQRVDGVQSSSARLMASTTRLAGPSMPLAAGG